MPYPTELPILVPTELSIPAPTELPIPAPTELLPILAPTELPTPAPTIYVPDSEYSFDFRSCSDNSSTVDAGVDGAGITATAVNGATCSGRQHAIRQERRLRSASCNISC